MMRALRRIGRSKIFCIAVLALLAGYFRTVAVQDTRVERPIRADALEYYLSAYNLVYHGIYSRLPHKIRNPSSQLAPDDYRPPGLPLIIAQFMDLWPQHERILARMQHVNVILGIGAVIAIFLCAAWILPLWSAVLVGVLTACSPHLISMTVYMLSETPGAFLVALLMLFAAVRLPENSAAKSMFLMALGVVAGALSMFRSAFLFFPPVMAMAFPCRADKLRALIFVSIGAALIVAPWLVRNALNVSHRNAPSIVAATLLDGAYRGYVLESRANTFPYGARHDPMFTTLEKDVGVTIAFVANKIAQDPVGMLAWYVLEKPVYLYQWSNIDGVGDVFVYQVNATPFSDNAAFKIIHRLMYVAHVPLLALALVGCVLAWTPVMRGPQWQRAQTAMRTASLVFAYHYAIHLPFAAVGRYTTPILPVIFLLAVFSLAVGVSVARAYWRRTPEAVHPRAVQPQASVSGPRHR
jgi:hypothetical protein